MMKKSVLKPNEKRESFTQAEVEDIIDELLDKHHRVYDRLAEI